MKSIKKIVSLSLVAVMALSLMGGCGVGQNKVKLDPEKPVTISIWHYYNGAIMNAFDSIVAEFNETIGIEKGIIVEAFSHGNLGELEKAVIASANKEIGSMEMPNIFASYADTAYEAEKLGLLADLDDYFTKEEQSEYLEAYIEEGKIGHNGELRIFPIAKSTEIFMLNETDWTPFAEANDITYEDLKTYEGVARTAETYYHWTDARTPDVPGDGKSFYGRDAMANFFIIAHKEFGIDLFEVTNGVAKINVDAEVMRKIWDYYYIPYISGYFFSYGRFRSDDAKVGDILAYIGSTASTSYFPSEVVSGSGPYPVEAKSLVIPHFEGGERVMVQQGAGMVVTTGSTEEEYASIEFLKWFTQTEKNIEFVVLSGYMPVKKEASDYDTIKTQADKNGTTINEITDQTLLVALDEIKTSTLYTNKAFNNGAAARDVLESNLQDKAIADRQSVRELIESGTSLEEAVTRFNTEENFNHWLQDFTDKLISAAQ